LDQSWEKPVAREQRRLAAIVAADVVGYSRLMGRDESGTLARLREHRSLRFEPALARHGGRLVKVAGDGALAEFASAVDALAAVIEFQQSMVEANRDTPDDTAIVFRIGLHLGDLIVDGDDLYGDGVNIAARLETAAPAGGVMISGSIHEAVDGRLKATFQDLGRLELKNIERPVQAFSVQWNPVDWQVAAIAPTIRVASSPVAFAARPAVAVLPFDNMSGDPAEDYFVDGLTEDIITTLSYWRWFPVIGRNSTFAYKGKPKNAAQIGKELGAAYIVEGSARRGGNRVRITAQLIDAATGHHLWAERYDRDMADVFAVQDEISERVVVSIEPEIHRAEKERATRTRPEHLGAWDFALKALALQERMSRTGHKEAREILGHALTLDPGSAYAWSMLSLCHYHEGILGWAEDRDRALKASFEAGQRAVELDELDWLGHAMAGMGWLWTERDHRAALEEQERAVTLNPSAPFARHTLACIFEFSSRPAEAIPHIETLLRLDPRYRFASLAVADVAMCQFLLGDFQASRASAEKAVRMQPANVRARQRLVAALSALGLDDEAHAAAAALMRLQPDLTLDYIHSTYPFQSTVERDAFVAALRRVNLLAG
jgi:adenylate cyclase